MKNYPYLVQLSNKTEVQADIEELKLITDGIKTGSPIKLKRGIINPSFIVAIVPDMERWKTRFDDIMGGISSEEYKLEHDKRHAKGCTPLKDIFANSPLSTNIKQLNDSTHLTTE